MTVSISAKIELGWTKPGRAGRSSGTRPPGEVPTVRVAGVEFGRERRARARRSPEVIVARRAGRRDSRRDEPEAGSNEIRLVSRSGRELPGKAPPALYRSPLAYGPSGSATGPRRDGRRGRTGSVLRRVHRDPAATEPVWSALAFVHTLAEFDLPDTVGRDMARDGLPQRLAARRGTRAARRGEPPATDDGYSPFLGPSRGNISGRLAIRTAVTAITWAPWIRFGSFALSNVSVWVWCDR